MPGAAFIGLRTNDVFTHAWDLAKATGLSTDLDHELATLGLEASSARIQPQMRNPGGPFGPEQRAQTVRRRPIGLRRSSVAR